MSFGKNSRSTGCASYYRTDELTNEQTKRDEKTKKSKEKLRRGFVKRANFSLAVDSRDSLACSKGRRIMLRYTETISR